MTTNIPMHTPSSMTKGDSMTWKYLLSEYKASEGWALNFYLRGPSSLDMSASISGDEHVIAISSADSKGLSAGEYEWMVKVSKAEEIYSVGRGRLTVLSDITDVGAGHDARPHCKIMLDQIEATLQGKSSQDVESYTIQGRSLTRMSPEELEKWRDKYRREWILHQRKTARRNGKSSGRKIKVRFNR